MAEAQHAAAARAATPEGALACAPARDHAHRRGVLYLRMGVPPPPPRRHIRRDLVGTLRRRLGGAESRLDLLGRSDTGLGQETGPRQVWSQ